MIRIIPLVVDELPELAFDTVIGPNFLGDHALAGGDEGDNAGGLAARAHLKTAVLLSLFTDRAADESELRAGDEQRGWPGDALTATAGAARDPLGSKLWLLRRRQLTADEAVLYAEIWTREALAWLIEDQVATAVDVRAERSAVNFDRLDLAVTITGPAGTALAERFAIHWRTMR